MVSLLQPPPEAYEQFDRVMLMREGSIVYHGRDTARTSVTVIGVQLPCFPRRSASLAGAILCRDGLAVSQ
jgi:ABC-type multidrug transport system ATPase subunit